MTVPGAPALRVMWGRKLIHLSTAALPVAWAYGVLDAPSVRILLGVALGVAVGLEWGRRVSPPFRARVVALAGPLLKEDETLAITGGTWLMLAMLVAVVALPEPAARVALWAGAAGDSAAAFVGGAWRGRADRSTTSKSPAGSGACVVVTAVGAAWLGDATLVAATAVGLVAAIAEWPRRYGDDNLRVTLVAGGAAWLFGVG